MNNIQHTFNQLAEASPIAENLFIPEGQVPISISQPIDVGADRLLRDYRNAWLTYPPLELEYLIQTLNEHLNNCVEIRLKAQELEIKAFADASDQLLQRKLLETLQNQIQLFAENEPKLLGNTINTRYLATPTSGSVTGDQTSTYWKDVLKEQESQLKYKFEDANSRLARMNEQGSGNNYIARFEFLKKTLRSGSDRGLLQGKSGSLGP